MTKERALAGIAVLAIAAPLAGCMGRSSGVGNGSGGGTASGPVVQTISVRETEMKLNPANPKIKKPGVVQLNVKNAGHTVHALAIQGPKGQVATQSIQPGRSATLKVDLSKPGKYRWYCPVGNHADEGMKGTVTVG